jgi:curved DNA-binding protein CbpA
MKNPYEVLGVGFAATAQQIKRAYQRRISDAHPDRGGSTQETQEINDAYAVLSDETRRRRFDETGDTSSEGNLQEIAKGILSNEFAKILDGGNWQNPLNLLAGALSRVTAEADAALAQHAQRLTHLNIRAGDFAASAGQSMQFLEPVIKTRIEECEKAMRACQRLKLAVKVAQQMLTENRSGTGAQRVGGWLT